MQVMSKVVSIFIKGDKKRAQKQELSKAGNNQSRPLAGLIYN
jgi:hypothetical protein